MSKQSQATSIYEMGIEIGHNRQAIIGEIVEHVGVSPAYASTLYNNARKALNKAQAPKTPAATTHTKPKSSSNKIEEFNRQNCRTVDNAIEAALKQVEDQFGISIKIGGGRFSTNEFTTKITVTTGDGSDAARAKWNAYAFRFGLNDSDFGKTFTSNGEQFTITGLNPRRKKYPVSAVNSRGTSYKFGAESVKRHLGQ